MDKAKLTLRIARSTQATYERHVQELKKLVAEKQRALKQARRQADEARYETDRAFNALTALCNEPPEVDIFKWLAPELLFLICSYLGYADRVAFASCSKYTRQTRVTSIERFRFIQEDVRGLTCPGSGPKKQWEGRTKRGRMILGGLQARYPGTEVFQCPVAYDGDDVRAYVHVLQWKSKLVWGTYEMIVQGSVRSMKKHPVLPVVVVLSFIFPNEYSLVVWDGQKKWEALVGKPLAPLYIQGNAVRFYTNEDQYII